MTETVYDKAEVYEGIPDDTAVVRASIVLRWSVVDLLGQDEKRALLHRCVTGDPSNSDSFAIWAPAGSEQDRHELMEMVSEGVAQTTTSTIIDVARIVVLGMSLSHPDHPNHHTTHNMHVRREH